ncbi:uncharacterized protein LOC124808635 [Hydra vulgaris]|uniref:uncharacterized protein LOC124808635 n=1 Tax=Hydra vulgaris TaxID=6087 RepID=UPI001F5ED7CA|nr:uncharacterized protein LOC124808635 [Hydra vulgaris]
MKLINGKKCKKRPQVAAYNALENLYDISTCRCNLDEVPCYDDKESSSDSEYNESIAISTYNLRKLDNFALECVRYAISSEAAAALGNGLLKDLGVITKTDKTDVLDKSKMNQAKKRVCLQSVAEHNIIVQNLSCIGCDSKDDKGSLVYRSMLPDSISKKNKLIEKSTFEVLKQYNSVDSLLGIVFDITNVNTGYKTGLCASLERKLGRTIHKIGCALHSNELPLRHIIEQLDGGTNTPQTFFDEIGKGAAQDLHHKPIAKFEPVLTSLVFPENSVINDLSSDQRLLLEYVCGISSGVVNPVYAHYKIGPVNHARWLTLAIRILVLHSRTEQPTPVLKEIVNYIQTEYGPTWFAIKRSKNFTEAPKILYTTLKNIKNFSQTIQDIILPVVLRNVYCLLPENFLLSLFVDDLKDTKQSS